MTPLKWIDRYLEESVACVCLVIIACSVFAQVVARYVFSTALHWTEEVASMSMVWAVYMGAALCVRERFHIRIIVLVTALPERFGRVMVFVADLLWLFFCLFMLKVGVDYLTVLWKFPARSPSLGINQFYPQSILVIGYGLMLFRLLQFYVLWWREGRQGLPGILEDTDALIEHHSGPRQ